MKISLYKLPACKYLLSYSRINTINRISSRNVIIASSSDSSNILGITLSLGGGIANNGGPITPSTVSLISEGKVITRPFSVLPTFKPVTAIALLIPLITDDSLSAKVPSSLLTSILETGRVFLTGSSSSGTTC